MARKNTFMEFARKHELHAVYIADCPGKEVSKIGIATDPRKRVGGHQASNWEALRLFRYWWTVGRPVSQRIEANVIMSLKKRKIRGEWFSVSPEKMAREVEEVAARLSLGIMEEADLLDLVKEWEDNGGVDTYAVGRQYMQHDSRALRRTSRRVQAA